MKCKTTHVCSVLFICYKFVANGIANYTNLVILLESWWSITVSEVEIHASHADRYI